MKWCICVTMIVGLGVFQLGCPPGVSDSPVKANFSAFPNQGEAPLTVAFQNLSTLGGGEDTVWFWSFGDGGTSEERNPQHNYETFGVYDVSLTVMNSLGTDTLVIEELISVIGGPAASFEADVTSGFAPLTVQFTDTSSAGSSPITEWYWEFGDGESSTERNPVHVYEPIGRSFDVSLTVRTEVGESTALYEDLVFTDGSQYHSQDFGAGTVNLQGKQLYFIPTPGESAYQRRVLNITRLGNDPAGDASVNVSAAPQEVVLGLGNAVNFYGSLYQSIFISADGTIGMGEAGSNADLVAHFSQPQVSLLPVDAIGGGTVTVDVTAGDSIAVTYEGVTAGGGSATAQVEFFINQNMYGDIALSYLQISPNAAGVIGLSNGQLDRADQATIEYFLESLGHQLPLTVETMTGTVF